ncbi:MAG: 4Fe-4S dicluster domain-containing protein [Spirochaetales bacterium]|nr:4Fe-4S dicluster domain-containing protein [Spirochaetales bacterium]
MSKDDATGKTDKREKDMSPEIDLSKADNNFKYDIASRPGASFFKRCFSCGTCTASCPVSDVEPEFNPRLIIRQCLLGLREEVLSSKLLWYCTQCYTCYARCPQDVRFTDVMAELRNMAVEEGFSPPVMAEKAEKINDISQKLRCNLNEYAWLLAKGEKPKGLQEKMNKVLTEGLKELE